MRNKLRMGIGFLLLVLVLGFFGINYVIYGQVASVEPFCDYDERKVDNTPANFIRHKEEHDFDTSPYFVETYEEVTILSRDTDISINGWWMPVEDEGAESSAPAVVIVHGIGACKRNDNILTAAGMLHRNGFNVLTIDQREHGDSEVEDGRIAGGSEEYLDVLGAWDWVITEQGIPQEQVGLMGFSLGAATVTIAMAEEPNVPATWEDSGFAAINDIVGDELERKGFPRFLATTSLMIGGWVSGDSLTSKPPLEAVKHLNGRPFHIVHSTTDARVSIDYAYDLVEAIRESGGEIEPWIVSDIDHVQSVFYVTDEYEERLVAFFSEALGKE